jgi:hypothetical protein
MKKGLVISWLILLSAGIGILFWHNAWKYNLPTPVPSHYQDVPRGAQVHLPASASATLAAARTRPLFLHFFNPDCPCSRFNMPQFKALVRQYGRQVSFAIVVMGPKKYTAEQIQSTFGLPYPIPVLTDSAIAAACGVYSTPQAVLLDNNRLLFYRGNYNRNRYCTDEKTSFASQALDGLLHHDYSLSFNPLALKAYGCQLPSCRQ